MLKNDDANFDPSKSTALTQPLQTRIDKEREMVIQSKSPEEFEKDLAQSVKAKHFLGVWTTDMMTEIGQQLIINNAIVKKVALKYGMNPAEMRSLIRTEPVLMQYYRIACRGVKNLVDEKVLEMLDRNAPEDKDIIKVVLQMMYQGRKKGGYNINEFGLDGYKDIIAMEQKEAIAADLDEDKLKPVINIQFNNQVIELKPGENVVDRMVNEFIDGELISSSSDSEDEEEQPDAVEES